ncbi:cobamide remodeling phosphodiesterase CbiR [Chloroflexota bacterium]
MQRFPFRVGSTSYVFPAGLAENARRLAAQGLSQDMELVLFDLENGPSNFPDAATVQALGEVAADYDLTYTVHLPLDLRLADDGGRASVSLQKAQRVIEATLPLEPAAYVGHLGGTDNHASNWAARATAALQIVAGWLPSPELLAIENLDGYNLDKVASVLAALPLKGPVSRTLDIGHLWKQGRDPLPVLAEWLPTTRVVHLHGFDAAQGRDHVSLAVMPAAQLDPVLAALRDYQGVLTLEVFEDAFFSSRAALLAGWDRVQAS